MFILEGENAVNFLAQKISNIRVVESLPPNIPVYKDIVIKVDDRNFYHDVVVTSITNPYKKFSHKCLPLSEDILDVGYSIIMEFDDTYRRDYVSEFIIKVFRVFEEFELSMIKIDNFVCDHKSKFYDLTGLYIEFDDYSKVFFERGCVASTPTFEYNSSAVIGSNPASVEQTFDFTKTIGSGSMQNRSLGDCTGIVKTQAEFFDKYTNAVVITDDPTTYNFEYFNTPSAREQHFVRGIVDLNDIGYDLDKAFERLYKKHKITTLIVTKMSKEFTYEYMQKVKNIIIYCIACEIFRSVIIMEPRFSVHSNLDFSIAGQRTNTFILGPSDCGLLSPGNFTTGNIRSPSIERGNVAIITRDLSIMDKVLDITRRNSHGIYECVALGTAKVGMACSFADCVYRLAQCNTVHMIILIESSNYRAPSNDLEFLIQLQEDDVINKPVLAWWSNSRDNKMLLNAGFYVPPSLDDLEPFLNNLYRQLHDHLNKEIVNSVKFIEEYFKAMGVSTEDYDDEGNETTLQQIKNSFQEST